MRALPALFLVLVFAGPVLAAQGTWTITTSVPSAFRPDRFVTMTYTVSSTSVADLPTDWMIHLWTCTDTNTDNTCTASDARLVDWTEKRVQANGGSSATASWSVNLLPPEATQLAYFLPRCTSTPCSNAPTTSDARSVTFQLRYTNTWTRTLTTPLSAVANSTVTITYRLASTSLDDKDLAGNVTLYSKPNGDLERNDTAKPVSVNANSQSTLAWTGILMTSVGPQQERVADTTTLVQSFGNTSVLVAHLHVNAPANGTARGGPAGFYVATEGHGLGPNAAPLSSIGRLVLRNGTFTLATIDIVTDVNGTAYVPFQGGVELDAVDWASNVSASWQGIAFATVANGSYQYAPSAGALENDVHAIRASLDGVSLGGVHLDDLASHNLLILVGKATLAAMVFAGLLLLMAHIAVRM